MNKHRNIFLERPMPGWKDPVCWILAFVLWAFLWNTPKFWDLLVDFVKGFFL